MAENKGELTVGQMVSQVLDVRQKTRVLRRGFKPEINVNTREAAVGVAEKAVDKKAGLRKVVEEARSKALNEHRPIPRLIKSLKATNAWEKASQADKKAHEVSKSMQEILDETASWIKNPANKAVLDAEISRAKQTAGIIYKIAGRLAGVEDPEAASGVIKPEHYEVAEVIYDRVSRAIVYYATANPDNRYFVPRGIEQTSAGNTVYRGDFLTASEAATSLWQNLLTGDPSMETSNIVNIGLGKPVRVTTSSK